MLIYAAVLSRRIVSQGRKATSSETSFIGCAARAAIGGMPLVRLP